VITNRYITVRIKYLGFSDFYLKNGKILWNRASMV
jgi:hypothetical protein